MLYVCVCLSTPCNHALNRNTVYIKISLELSTVRVGSEHRGSMPYQGGCTSALEQNSAGLKVYKKNQRNGNCLPKHEREAFIHVHRRKRPVC